MECGATVEVVWGPFLSKEFFDRGTAVDDFHGAAEGAHVFFARVDVEAFADCAEQIVGGDRVVGDGGSVGG